jgi:hypothetical protein
MSSSTALRTLDSASPGKKEVAAAAAERAGTGRYAAAQTPLKLIQGTK